MHVSIKRKIQIVSDRRLHIFQDQSHQSQGSSVSSQLYCDWLKDDQLTWSDTFWISYFLLRLKQFLRVYFHNKRSMEHSNTVGWRCSTGKLIESRSLVKTLLSWSVISISLMELLLLLSILKLISKLFNSLSIYLKKMPWWIKWFRTNIT